MTKIAHILTFVMLLASMSLAAPAPVKGDKSVATTAPASKSASNPASNPASTPSSTQANKISKAFRDFGEKIKQSKKPSIKGTRAALTKAKSSLQNGYAGFYKDFSSGNFKKLAGDSANIRKANSEVSADTTKLSAMEKQAGLARSKVRKEKTEAAAAEAKLSKDQAKLRELEG